jgi:hypothetical protein
MRASGIGVTVMIGLAACGGPTEPVRASRTDPPADAAPASSAGQAAADGGAARRAPFVVAIVVDQLSAWVAAQRFSELPTDGGFARLVREGTWVKTTRYPYAVTDTGPGHASLHTGKVPAESGIFGNEVPGPPGKKRISILRDEKTRAVGPAGPMQEPGWSAARLRVDTVGDRLRAAHPDALVVSISLKERGAILPAGKRPTHALWYDASIDSFVTSTAFTDTYPRWALGVGDTKAIVAARAKPWVLTDLAWVKAHAATPDNQPGEGDLEGLGITFPHTAKTGNAFRALPASDAMVAELGLAAIGAEYDPARPTLLLLSFSASDVVGHVFGPDSWEAWDHLRKLDATINAVIESLDRRVGAPVAVMVSADHGNISMPEVSPERAGVKCGADPYERPCTAGERLGPNAIRDELIVATKAALGPGRWIDGLADPYVFLTPEARALSEPRRGVLDQVVRTTVGRHAGVAEILDARMLALQCPAVLASALGVPDRARAGEPVLTLVCRSWSAGAGDYYVIPKPGSFFDGELVFGKGTSHGTPYLYDRTVSMLVRAPGVVDAGVAIDDPVDFSVYAALEAALVGLDTRAPRDILAAHRANATASPRTKP